MDLLRHHALRILASGMFFLVAGVVIWTSNSSRVDLLFSVLMAAPFAIGGAIVAAPLIMEICSAPLEALVYPGARFDRPQPMYSIPASKKAKGLYEEAVAGYEKIAREYPDEIRPYVEMLTIVIVNLRDEHRAGEILRRAFAAFPEAGDRSVLQRVFDDNMSRLQAAPEWFSEQAQRSLVPESLKDEGPVAEPDGRLRRRFHTGGEGTYAEPGEERKPEARRVISYDPAQLAAKEKPGRPEPQDTVAAEKRPDVSDPSSAAFSLGRIAGAAVPPVKSQFDLEKVLPILNSISILGGMDDAQIRKVLAKMERRMYPAGARIFTVGEPSSSIYIISSGRVKIVAEENGKTVELAQYPVGQCFGESSAIGILRHSATAEVMEATELMVLPAKNLHVLYHEDPGLFGLLILNIAREACRRLHKSNQLILHYASGRQ